MYLGNNDGVIYYDEIRVGDSTSSLAEVSPDSGSPAEVSTIKSSQQGKADAIYDISGRRVSEPGGNGIFLYRVKGKIIKRVFLR